MTFLRPPCRVDWDQLAAGDEEAIRSYSLLTNTLRSIRTRGYEMPVYELPADRLRVNRERIGMLHETMPYITRDHGRILITDRQLVEDLAGLSDDLTEIYQQPPLSQIDADAVTSGTEAAVYPHLLRIAVQIKTDYETEQSEARRNLEPGPLLTEVVKGSLVDYGLTQSEAHELVRILHEEYMPAEDAIMNLSRENIAERDINLTASQLYASIRFRHNAIKSIEGTVPQQFEPAVYWDLAFNRDVIIEVRTALAGEDSDRIARDNGYLRTLLRLERRAAEGYLDLYENNAELRSDSDIRSEVIRLKNMMRAHGLPVVPRRRHEAPLVTLSEYGMVAKGHRSGIRAALQREIDRENAVQRNELEGHRHDFGELVDIAAVLLHRYQRAVRYEGGRFRSLVRPEHVLSEVRREYQLPEADLPILLTIVEEDMALPSEEQTFDMDFWARRLRMTETAEDQLRVAEWLHDYMNRLRSKGLFQDVEDFDTLFIYELDEYIRSSRADESVGDRALLLTDYEQLQKNYSSEKINTANSQQRSPDEVVADLPHDLPADMLDEITAELGMTTSQTAEVKAAYVQDRMRDESRIVGAEYSLPDSNELMDMVVVQQLPAEQIAQRFYGSNLSPDALSRYLKDMGLTTAQTADVVSVYVRR
ncbi:MAG: hypothetical protein TR69_WS6001000751 [candidate division WS6 bacterium OLB20]|uniref:Uncharacterized protein n=1 Tax=candidate division WS6 bacterium OLB20 TaxID=1617426 RepID=A0A136LYP5_9BACT|nr:MAG: hypothetical protein TR69_WS6001000751 [candidate division WS6 bacterium OLB20]